MGAEYYKAGIDLLNTSPVKDDLIQGRPFFDQNSSIQNFTLKIQSSALLLSLTPDESRAQIKYFNEILENIDQMDEVTCYELLKNEFDGDHLRTLPVDGKILVISPGNHPHHKESVRVRLKDLCRTRISDLEKFLPHQ